MRKDIKVLKENNPKSIIVIVGDHGPYLTKNCTALKKYKQNTLFNRLDIFNCIFSFLIIH